MELLVLLVAGLLEGVFVLAGGIAAGLFSLLAELFGAIFGALWGSRRKEKPAQPSQPAPQRKRSPILKHLMLVPAVLIGGGLLVVNSFFLEDTARWGVAKINARSDIDVSFDQLDGNLFTGRFHIENLHATKPGGNGIGFDVSVGDISVDVAMPSVLFGTITVESLAISDTEGSLTRAPKQDATDQEGASEIASAEEGRKIEGGRDFTIEQLQITNAQMLLHSGGEMEPVDVRIASAVSAPLRSNWAVFDFFFRSNISATVNGAEFQISTTEITKDGLGGRRTEWMIAAMPLDMFASYLPRAPFTWLNGGQLSASVVDEWQYGEDEKYVDLDWSITLANTSVQVPQGAGAAQKLMAGALARVVNAREDDVVLAFSTRIDRDRFENSASLDASGVWEEMRKGLIEKLTPGGEVQEQGENGGLLNDAKDLLRRRLQGDADGN